jgi:hypothetical protein
VQGDWSYRAHGLDITSQFELAAFDPVDDRRLVDVLVRAESSSEGRSTAATFDVTRGSGVDELQILADDSVHGRRLRLFRRPDGAVLVLGEGIALDVASDGSRLTALTDGTPAAEASMPWLVGGLGIATTLMMRGSLVLHASAFVFEGRGHLVMARSGYGKSLVTAAASASGAVLVAEDTVRVEPHAAGWIAHPGSCVLRTRRTTPELAAWFGADRASLSADGRAVVRFESSRAALAIDELHLIALDAEATTTRIDPIAEASALVACLGHVRVPGLVPGPVLDRHFDQVGSLVSRVPLDLVRLPWSGDLAALAGRVRGWLESPAR